MRTQQAPPAVGTVSDGLLVAAIDRRGPWRALRHLRAGMMQLGTAGARPQLCFVHALADDGSIVPGRDRRAAVFVLGYRCAR